MLERAVVAAGANVSEIFVSFQGEGVHAGRRQLFVRLGGCPLRCRYCDTPESLKPVSHCRVLGPDGSYQRANPLDAAALDAEVEALRRAAPPLHALAVTGGEPLAQVDFLEAWLARRRTPLPVLLETAGIWPQRLARLLPFVAIVSLDFKCPSNTGERARWDEHAACLDAAVAARKDVYVKMPVDAGTDPAEVAHGAHLVARAGAPVPLLLTPLTSPDGGRMLIDASGLERLHAVASREHADVRILPQLHKVLSIP
ncbi:MAG TPA: 7-carboxy-7-deazaguanine synthase QueE [Candidatus Limnocylindria bacterium]|nr:7-carboxy-7-deazaguanine synthase QueE [Candidatus Limnocylindria bacterium]